MKKSKKKKTKDTNEVLGKSEEEEGKERIEEEKPGFERIEEEKPEFELIPPRHEIIGKLIFYDGKIILLQDVISLLRKKLLVLVLCWKP